MSLVWVIYFAGVSDGLSKFSTFVGAILFIFSIVGVMMSIASILDGWKQSKVIQKLTLVAIAMSITSSIIGLAIPDKTTIYMMAGTRVAEDIVKSPEVKEINGKILTIINQKLDSIIEPANKEK